MALICPVCKSDEAQHLAGDIAQCRSCEAHFNSNTGEVETVTTGGTALPVPNPPAAPEAVAEVEVPEEPAPEPAPEPPDEPADLTGPI